MMKDLDRVGCFCEREVQVVKKSAELRQEAVVTGQWLYQN